MDGFEGYASIRTSHLSSIRIDSSNYLIVRCGRREKNIDFLENNSVEGGWVRTYSSTHASSLRFLMYLTIL